jgi:hypothetical protein
LSAVEEVQTIVPVLPVKVSVLVLPEQTPADPEIVPAIESGSTVINCEDV